MKDNFLMIDPPVTPYSKPEDIEKWLTELRALAQTEEVNIHIAQAKEWLERAKKGGDK